MNAKVFDVVDGYPYDGNQFILGCISENAKGKVWWPYSIATEKHAITIAGSGSGKGVCVITPNLRKWANNILVIDPKGEAAELTAKDREAMGQSINVVDPFDDCNVEDRFRATCNPLDELDLNSNSIREDILTIADGIVMRHEPKHARWDNAGVNIIAGLIAFVKIAEAPENQNLIRVREILTDEELFSDAVEIMSTSNEVDGILKSAATIIKSQKDNEFTENALSNTEWLDSQAMKKTLKSSSFSLSDLKNKDCSVYLVLPANRLGQQQHGRFLRLFVRCAMDAMQKKTADGQIKNKRCLFLLDEFYSLGHIEEIATAAGIMRGYGLQLWIVMQDLGQLTKLYGQEGAQTFFGNSDIHQFFGNMDSLTLDYISKNMGNIIEADLARMHPPPVKNVFEDQNEFASRQAGWLHVAPSYLGRPRLPADEVAAWVGKKRKDLNVSHQSIIFLAGRKKISVPLLPYMAMDSLTWDLEKYRNPKRKKFLGIF